MAALSVNLIAVLASSVVIFFLGSLWYSPLLFAKKWTALLEKTSSMPKGGANPRMFLMAFITCYMTSFVLAFVINLTKVTNPLDGALVGLMCWIGFTGAPTYNNQVNFLQRDAALWAIDSGYNLVSFALAGALFTVWK